MSNRGAGWEKIESSEGNWYCAEGLRSHFEAAGLKFFSDWMALRGIAFREVSMRSRRPVVSLDIPGLPVSLFLKRNLDSSLPQNPLETLRIERVRTEARRELDRLDAFSRAGINVPETISWGEGNWEGANGASFIVTKDLQGTPLERYLFHHWKPPLDPGMIAYKRTLLSELASLTRKMHNAGLVHRDYYLGHVFVGQGLKEGEALLSVIDVQRASHRPRWWIRPRIKDLASLHFSADPQYIRPSDRLRFLMEYWKVNRLTRWQKFQVAWITRKAERIRRHTEKALGIPYSEYFKNKYY